ncbi:MAG: hypothetical protein KDD41_00610 [Flavobacteriales bacterium]|nr:hypothetical protein [Flavobacteriales bacterium]
MVKNILVAILLTSGIYSFGQETSEQVVRPGLIRAQGTISFGSFSDLDQSGLYLHGDLEYYLNPNITARGDLYFYLKPNNESILEHNHQLFSGASYHIATGSNIDPYIGLQPGLAVSQVSNTILTAGNKNPRPAASPLISGVFGFNYYAAKWFHLFADARYVYGDHQSNIGTLSLNEFRFSFGLGFNIQTKK